MPEQCCSCGGPCGKGPCRYGKGQSSAQKGDYVAYVESTPLLRMDDGSPLPDSSIIEGMGTGWTAELAADICDAWATLHQPLPHTPFEAKVKGVLWGRYLGIKHAVAYHLTDSDLCDDLIFLDELEGTLHLMQN